MNNKIGREKALRVIGLAAFVSVNILGYFCIWIFSDELGALASFFLALTWVFASRLIVLALFAAASALARRISG